MSNYSAATLNSNTVYLDNIETTSTASTINGINIGNITANNSIKFKEIKVDDWDMNAVNVLNIPHNLSSSEWKTITNIGGRIRNDADTLYNGIVANRVNASPDYPFIASWNSSNIIIESGTAPWLSVDYNATGFTRAWITFWYTPD